MNHNFLQFQGTQLPPQYNPHSPPNMPTDLSSQLSRLERSTQRAQESFAPLRPQQLNWKSHPGRWSVGQCLDHLITTNALYFPLFDQITQGTWKPNLWERLGLFSGFLGKMLVRDMGPEVKRKSSSPAAFRPSQSEIPGDIVSRFVDHQTALLDTLRQLPHDLDQRIVSSPAASFITYSLGDAVQIITGHEERHLNQAQAVMETEGFPT